MMLNDLHQWSTRPTRKEKHILWFQTKFLVFLLMFLLNCFVLMQNNEHKFFDNQLTFALFYDNIKVFVYCIFGFIN